jgi:hypothetical protein
MPGLSAADIVRVWERGAGQHPIDRALTMLEAGGSAAGEAALDDLPIGERNRRLLDVRARTFGGTLEALATCSSCSSRVEIHLDVASLASGSHAARAATADATVDVRALTSRDLAAAAGCADPDAARLLLARRAVDGGAATAVLDDVPHADAIAHRLEEIDPLAVVTFDVTCPVCESSWESELDVAQFLWVEIETEALRVLRDVHVLAAAYGWREADILAMTPLRRRAYLELVQ